MAPISGESLGKHSVLRMSSEGTGVARLILLW